MGNINNLFNKVPTPTPLNAVTGVLGGVIGLLKNPCSAINFKVAGDAKREAKRRGYNRNQTKQHIADKLNQWQQDCLIKKQNGGVLPQPSIFQQILNFFGL